MADFSQNIQDFQRYGKYVYKFDNVGNNIFNSASSDFSQVYLAFPISDITYNNTKINSFYTTSFQEFMPVTIVNAGFDVDTLQQQLTVIESENTTLKTQLNSIIEQSNADSGSSMIQASKQIIIGLRIALGEGRVESNFSSNFPFVSLISPKPRPTS